MLGLLLHSPVCFHTRCSRTLQGTQRTQLVRCTSSSRGRHRTSSLRTRRAAVVCAAEAAAEAVPVLDAEGKITRFPESAGVYAVYSKDQKLQYVGLSRKISTSIEKHAKEVPHLIHAVKAGPLPQASRDQLIEIWKEWVQDAVSKHGQVPPGNAAEKGLWQAKRAKPELKLTPGKGLQDLTVPLETLIDQLVKTTKVVAFIKGTRQQPQCGFSYKVLSVLNDNKADYEVVNVLDEHFNPGLRETLKSYSQWPTIPQLYVNGEFLGGADIVEEMQQSGELSKVLSS